MSLNPISKRKALEALAKARATTAPPVPDPVEESPGRDNAGSEGEPYTEEKCPSPSKIVAKPVVESAPKSSQATGTYRFASRAKSR